MGCDALIGLKRHRVLADLDWVCSWFGFYIYREAMLSQPIPPVSAYADGTSEAISLVGGKAQLATRCSLYSSA